MARSIAAACAALVLLALPAHAAAPTASADSAAAPPSLLVFDVEVEGDLSDATRRPEWARRAALLTGALKEELAATGRYRVVDSSPAADLLADLATRREAHACEACLVEVAERLDVDRMLAAWVFRVSNLILTLHLELRDGDSGALVARKTLDFRGDNDRAWLKAGSYFVRWLDEAKAAEE